MRTIHRTLTIAAFFFALSGAAHAGTIATAALQVYSGDTAHCEISNVGATNVTLTEPTSIFGFAGNSLVCCSSCGAVLASGQSCFDSATIESANSARCTVSVQGTAKNIRAVLEIIDSSGATRSTTEAR